MKKRGKQPKKEPPAPKKKETPVKKAPMKATAAAASTPSPAKKGRGKAAKSATPNEEPSISSDPEYKEKRARNNDAVNRCRQKKKEEGKKRVERVSKLKQENVNLKAESDRKQQEYNLLSSIVVAAATTQPVAVPVASAPVRVAAIHSQRPQLSDAVPVVMVATTATTASSSSNHPVVARPPAMLATAPITTARRVILHPVSVPSSPPPSIVISGQVARSPQLPSPTLSLSLVSPVQQQRQQLSPQPKMVISTMRK